MPDMDAKPVIVSKTVYSRARENHIMDGGTESLNMITF